MTLAAALFLLAATPVSLTVDLSRDTTARLGPRVRELVVERLLEEGFAVEPGAKLKLGVEELHGTLRLSARVGEYSASSELRPATEWPAELGFELAQRLAVLAHEAEAHVPAPAPPQTMESLSLRSGERSGEGPTAQSTTAPHPDPLPAGAGRGSTVEPVEPGLRLSAGIRLGILARAGGVDPTLSFHGALPGVVEPIVSMGVTFAPGPGLTAWELPLLGGVRVPIAFSGWTLSPELSGGGRLHLFTEGVRLDPLGVLAVALLRSLGAIKLGVRLGFEVSTAREHRQGEELLWSRGGFAFSAMLQLER